MIIFCLSLNQIKNRDKEYFKEDERGNELALLLKQLSKEKSDLGDEETDIELHEQLSAKASLTST